MEFVATITGYLIIVAVCVFVITMGVYWTIHRIIDALGVRQEFLKMKRERDAALAEVRDARQHTAVKKDA